MVKQNNQGEKNFISKIFYFYFSTSFLMQRWGQLVIIVTMKSNGEKWGNDESLENELNKSIGYKVLQISALRHLLHIALIYLKNSRVILYTKKK